MELALTATAADTGVMTDLRISAAASTPAAVVLDAIRALVAAPPTATLSVGGRPVLRDGDLAHCGLVDGVVVRVGGPPAGSPGPGFAEVVVVSGPDAGRHVPLGAGRLVIGRDAGCDLALTDSSVSRRHACLEVTPCRSPGVGRDDSPVMVHDLGSANGTRLGGVALEPMKGGQLPGGAPLRVGDTVVRLEAVWPTAARVGSEAVRRAPRPRAAGPGCEVEFPQPPSPLPPVRVPMLAAFAPVVVGSALALSMHQWQFLAFTAMSPAVVLGQAAGDRRSARRSARAASRQHRAVYAEAAARCARELAIEQSARESAAPDLAVLARAARGADAPLWQRCRTDPDWLTARIGTGELAASLRITGAPAATVRDVPLCLSLAGRVVGACGPRPAMLGLLRSLVVQAAALHGPDELSLVVLAPGRAAGWSWTRWLPHVRPRASAAIPALGFDDRQVAARLEEIVHRPPVGHTLVVVDADGAPAILRRLDSLVGRGQRTDAGPPTVSVLWGATSHSSLPHLCDAVARVSADGGARVVVHDGELGAVEGVPDLVSAAAAEAIARDLAPLQVAGVAAAGMSALVRWSDLAGAELGDADTARRWLARSWARGPTTDVLLGSGQDGPVRVDLCRDGPHALVAGTTGAGKSQLLLGIVAGLAAGNQPDQLALLLVDHKGGATFGACAGLPHVAGILTDLDAASTRRALQSLTAELRRREARFALVGAVDLDGYRAAMAGEPLEPIARLVVVVDEFAVLADEQAEFVRGLVGIAQRGRSLGVHLILATQRPEGVVSADIRANTRLRICLGVTREAESRDVIDSPAAAAISRTTPGRGYLRIGPGELRLFQAAQVAIPPTAPATVKVALSPIETLGDPVTDDDPAAVRSQPAAQTATDLDLLVVAAAELAAHSRLRAPHPPWLPPLPERLELSALDSPADGMVAWGLRDLPAQGRQVPLTAEPAGGAVVVIAGMTRSGRSTAARSRAVALAARLAPEQLQLWAIDAGSGLTDLATLPHCGAVVPAADEARVHRLLNHLRRTVDRRRHAPQPDPATLLLLVDGWETATALGPDRDGTTADCLLRLAADGPSARLQLVVTCERGGLAGRLAGVATERIALRLADPTDYALVGMPLRDLPVTLPAGRGVLSGEAAMVQVAVPDPAAVERAGRWRAPAVRAPSFAPLPRHVALADLGGGTTGVRLGLAADGRTVALDRESLAGGFVVAGPPGAGRTTALRLLALQLTGRPLAVAAAYGSALLATPAALVLPGDDQEHAAAVLRSLLDQPDGPPDVVIDDADLMADGPLRPLLEQLVRDPAGPVVAVGATVDSLAAAFRGPLATTLRARRGLLLTPRGRHDGAAFGVRLPVRRDGSEPRGRGWLLGIDTPLELQIADPRPAQPSTEFELAAWGGRRRE